MDIVPDDGLEDEDEVDGFDMGVGVVENSLKRVKRGADVAG